MVKAKKNNTPRLTLESFAQPYVNLYIMLSEELDRLEYHVLRNKGHAVVEDKYDDLVKEEYNSLSCYLKALGARLFQISDEAYHKATAASHRNIYNRYKKVRAVKVK